MFKFMPVKSQKEAKKECPTAAKIVKVEGGYACFDTVQDYEIWKNQK